MRLKGFRVKNYRSINDSGTIEVEQRTVLVGRNESGKSNLLKALASLNPVGKRQPLTYVKDFPRDRHKSAFSDDVVVLETLWEFTNAERSRLAAILPRAAAQETVTISRDYKGESLYIGFPGLPELVVDTELVKQHTRKLQAAVRASLKGQEQATADVVITAQDDMLAVISSDQQSSQTWAAAATAALKAFRVTLATTGLELNDAADDAITGVMEHIEAIAGDEDLRQKARNYVAGLVPTFIYLDDYPNIDGHQNLSQLIQRLDGNENKDGDQYFMKLMKVAGLDPKELQRLMHQDNHEERQMLTNRAAAFVTKAVKDLWHDRELKVHFNLDAHHFNTLISDPSSGYDITVNLNERSRGFRWFFSFFVTFAADTQGGSAEHAIILLDEPGLFLHALAQRDLLDLFASRFHNQILFTTHSPFMVPVEEMHAVRTVNIDATQGTTVTNDPKGDTKTLFPLQAALGYDITQSLFVGSKNLIVEGVSDFWYLTPVSDFLNETGGTGLPEGLVITPAGGAQKVSYLTALLAAQNLKVLVLLDDEKQTQRTKEDLAREKLIHIDNVILVTKAFPTPAPAEADIEDLLEPDVYKLLVETSYARELKGMKLALNAHIPRIVKRYEQAFEAVGLEFNKTRPAKLFLKKIAEDPTSMLPPASRARFEELFRVVGTRLTEMQQRTSEAFR